MLCRLCVYECLQEHASSLDSQQIGKLIAKYLQMELAPNNELKANIICNVCLQHLEDFDNFFGHIEKRQDVYNNLLVTKLEVGSNPDSDNDNSPVSNEEQDKEQNLSVCNSENEEPMAVLEFSYATCDDNQVDNLKFEKSETDTEDTEVDALLSKVKVEATAKLKRKKLKRKASKKSTKSKVENNEEQKQTKICPVKEQQKDELLAKYGSFQCELCNEKLENYKLFQAHFQKSHNQKAYITCCGKRLNSRSLIIEHVQRHANPEAFKCQLCNKTLKTQRSLKHHEKLMHKRAELANTCSICGKHFTYPSMLEYHMSVHDNSRKFACPHCDKHFKTEILMKYHVKNIHGERILHICDICGKEYRFKAAFEQHIAEHQGNLEGKRQQCHICKVYVSINYIKRHIQRHETVEVACDECGKQFTSRPVLQSHKERYHKKNQQIYTCTVCDKKFQKKCSFKEHIDMHTGNKEYTCKYCPREFRSKANMYAHVKKMHHEFWAQAQQERYQNPEQTRNACKNEAVEAIATSR